MPAKLPQLLSLIGACLLALSAHAQAEAPDPELASAGSGASAWAWALRASRQAPTRLRIWGNFAGICMLLLGLDC